MHGFTAHIRVQILIHLQQYFFCCTVFVYCNTDNLFKILLKIIPCIWNVFLVRCLDTDDAVKRAHVAPYDADQNADQRLEYRDDKADPKGGAADEV